MDDGFLSGEGLVAARVATFPEGVRFNTLRCALGASEASRRSVDTRCKRGGSGDVERDELGNGPREARLRGTMKP